jgi:hypothetical protein
MNEAERIARALKGRKSGNNWVAHCPCPNHAHGDKSQSLSIADGRDGKLLLKCFTGGTFDEVMAALRAKGLIDSAPRQRHDPIANMNARMARPASADYSLNETFDGPKAETYDFPRKPFFPDLWDRHHIYTDEAGNPVRLVAVKREPGAAKKKIEQYGMTASGTWDAKADKGPMVPYRLPELLGAPGSPVFICEGEKDADTLANFGHLATTNPCGALSWKPDLNKYFAGRDVFIVPDADLAGTKRIADLYEKLKDVVASFKVVALGLEYKEKDGEDITDWIEKHSHTNEEFIELARKAPEYRPDGQQNSSAALKYDLLHEMPDPLTPVPWMTKGIFARRETSMWYGPPGGLKSALLASATVAVASGENWFDRKSKGKFGVIYFALERADLVRRRLQAIIAREEIAEPLAIAVVPGILSLNTETDVVRIKATIAELADVFRKMGADGVGIIIFDTWAKLVAAGGGDENSAKDVGPVFANLQRIKDETDVHVALIGHTGKDVERGVRGSSAIPGDIDIGVLIDGDGIKTATVQKANAIPEGELFSFGSVLHMFGEDEDGDPVDVNVVQPLAIGDRFAGKERTWPRKLTTLRNALNEVLISSGVEYQIPLGPMVRRAKVSDLRDQYIKTCPYNGSNGDEGRAKAVETSWKRHFKDATDMGLMAYQHSGAWNKETGWVWDAT